MPRSLEGSIYQKGKTWYARLRYTDADGRSREKKRSCRSQSIAKNRLKDLKLEVENAAAGRKLYSDVDAFFRREYVHEARFVGGKIVSGYRTKKNQIEYYLDLLKDRFGERYVDEITYSDLFDLKRWLEQTPIKVTDERPEGKPRSVAEIHMYLKFARRVFNVAIEQGWLAVNPFRRGRPLIQNSLEVERTRILSVEEESRLLDQCTGPRDHLRPQIIFAIETGVRRGELETLKWSAVDLTRRTIKIEAGNTKTLRERLVPITERLRQVLIQLRGNTLKPNSRIFQNGDTKRSFNTACRLAGLNDVHFHDLRHTAITRMLEKGIPQALVMKISGHSQIKTFLRYVNQTPESIYDVAMRLDRATG